MEKRKTKNIAAVIDIGSNSLSMRIAQLVQGEIRVLDELVNTVSLGKDTFKRGKISQNKLNRICEILKKFTQAAEAYGIPAENICTVATTAVREAENRTFVLTQIKNRTGLCVRILDDSSEKTIIYKELLRRLSNIKKVKNPALITYIGAGSLGAALYDSGQLPLTLNIRLGSLRLSEMLGQFLSTGGEPEKIIGDYLHSFSEKVSS
ncbi:MAG: hypothetical protein IJC39_00620, partial [Firmicutes bacterium]|nr:hypothetical protein [Bacillota bacterium]